MGILNSIFQKIFPTTHPAAAQTPTSSAVSQSVPAQQSPAETTVAPATNQATDVVDVEKILDAMPSAQQFNWRTSIVDLMKLLSLDSGLQSRTALANELHYQGDTNDTASMNMWLHRQVMNKLAENGGKVPDDLKK